MFKKISIFTFFILLLSACSVNNNQEIKQVNKQKDEIQKVTKKWLWNTWDTGSITVSSWFTK